jgi:cysteinyl-tRNA synthetase
MTVRFFFLQAQYRSTVDFSNEALQASEKGLKRLLSSIELLEQIKPSEKSTFDVDAILEKCQKSMNDDFNTPITIAHLFDGIKFINLLKEGKETLTNDGLITLRNHYKTYVFDILGIVADEEEANPEILSDVMEIVISLRKKSKENKDYITSDFIRDELNKVKITLKDTKDGTTWEMEN